MDTPSSFDRAHHLRDDPDALEALLTKRDSLLLPLHSGRAPVSRAPQGEATLVSPSAAPRALAEAKEVVFLGMYDHRGVFALDVSNMSEASLLTELGHDSELQDLRALAATLPAWQAHMIAYGRSLLHFHRVQAFCGSCGGETRMRKGGHVRQCNQCDRELFPRTDPAVLVLVRHGSDLLLGRQANWPKGMYSTLAGFVEPGESLESAVQREVLEETGVEISDVCYQASQPWPFPCSLMVGFSATALHREIVVDDELEDAQFFPPETLLAPASADFFVPPAYSLAGQLIAAHCASFRP